MIKSKKIVIATHFLFYGAAHALRDYLNLKKVDDVMLISLPFHSQREVIVEEYKKGILTSIEKKKRHQIAELLNYLYDFFEVISTVFKKNESYDLFVGVNNLNCLAGLFLRKIKKVKRVIYYSIDFVPIRFNNKLLNYIYHEIEKFSITHADEVWNVSPRIAEGRRDFFNIKITSKQKVVPIGVWNKNIKRLGFDKVKKHQVIFIGHLLEKQGVQIIIEAIPDIIRDIKDFKFIVIGDGEYQSALKSLVKKKKLEKYIDFRGWVKDRTKVDQILSKNILAIATYKPEAKKLYNFTYYADPTKIKDYLSAGLPVLLTNVAYNAKELEKKGCAIVVEYNAKEIAMTIKNILKDERKLRVYRENALRVAKEFNWDKIFSAQTI